MQTGSEVQRGWLYAFVIAVAAGAAWLNTLSAPFIFDDLPGIVKNTSLRSVRQSLLDNQAIPTIGRPVVNLSLAINRAVGGLDVRGYHLTNLLIHICAALALGGIVRRTLGRAWAPEWLRSAAGPIGFATALLWVLHPLQTESVTCVIQRTESLAGLIYLVTLYCLVRGTEPAGRAPQRWLTGGVFACWAGMATKEIMVSAPLLLLLYDRTFAAGSFKEAWQKHRWFHTATALSWLLLAGLMMQTGHRAGTVALGVGVNAWTTLLTQCDAVVMYLKLSVWPHPLVLDYGGYATDAVISLGQVWPQAVLLVALATATLHALVRRPPLGFAGAWFFLILAPSSSFVPLLTQARAEHRMYLPLAAIVLLVVILIHRFGGRAAPVIVGGLALALGATTVARNRDYQTTFGIWQDTVQKRPGNGRAHFNLGVELARAGDRVGAVREYEEALRLMPRYVEPHLNLFALFVQEGRLPEAREHAEAALRLNPESSPASNDLGHVLFLEGDMDGAIRRFTDAVRLDPDNAEAQNNLGFAQIRRGLVDEAISHFRRAVAVKADFALAHRNLGMALRESGRNAEAVASLRRALQLDPRNAAIAGSLETWRRADQPSGAK
jgi:Flp pilus assembly protein TadD